MHINSKSFRLGAAVLAAAFLATGTAGAQTWQKINGSLDQISAAPDGTVWGVNSASTIFRLVPDSRGVISASNPTWQAMPR